MPKIGDRVTRKKEHHDDVWIRATNKIGVGAGDILVVKKFLGYQNHLINFDPPISEGGWEASRFGLILTHKPLKEYM